MWGRRSLRPLAVQGRLPFLIRAERRERTFKRSIIALTAVALVGFLAATPAGRYAARMLVFKVRALLARAVGLPSDRELHEAAVRAERLRNAASARLAMAEVAPPGSAMDAFLREVGMDAHSAVIRWGNVDRSIVLSSAVFEPDDQRSYRLKPGIASIWVIGLSFQKALAMFLIPDTPDARAKAQRAGGMVVPESRQTTNSWGCRGPEPDPAVSVRVLVLGDSMMQGALVGDSQTPPARLEAHLSTALETPVSVLNTGHIGYSPEQYDQTLRAFGDRFKPDFVVISVVDNDFGDLADPAAWKEGAHWINQIADLCMQRGWEFLLVPSPVEVSILGQRDLSRFQGPLSRIFGRGGTRYIDPLESFTDTLLHLANEGVRRGTETAVDPLYNLHLMGDHHFSPVGSDVWARVVARRLLLTWDRKILNGGDGPAPVIRHAHAAHPRIPEDRIWGETPLPSVGQSRSQASKPAHHWRESPRQG
jgi:hypothetical protein